MDYVVKKKSLVKRHVIYILIHQATSVQGGQTFSFEKTRLSVLMVGLLSTSLNITH